MTLLSKSAQLVTFAVVASVAGVAFAADKISLSCSGTLASKESSFESMPISNQSLVIDFAQGTVKGSMGNFSIIKVSDNSVAFKANDPTISGYVDRVTGSASVVAWKDQTHVLYHYQLTCRPAQPLF